MANHVRMFQPRFARAVADGTKRQTVRPVPKRPVSPGDHLSLRRWSGAPYRSPQVELARGVVTDVTPIGISRGGVTLAADILDTFADNDAFARADGFRDWADLIAWFSATHSLPFEGVLIRWR